MKECSTCNKDESQVTFRKHRNQCINCYNKNRRIFFKKKIIIEKQILKKQWYLDNKERLSEENKIKYIQSREQRLKAASDRYYDKNNLFSNLIRSAKARAKKADIIFELLDTDIEKLYIDQDGKCALTNITFCFEKQSVTRRPFSPSIDRINPNLGYTKNNIRLVCTAVNLALNEFGDQVFDTICKSYVNYQLNA